MKTVTNRKVVINQFFECFEEFMIIKVDSNKILSMRWSELEILLDVNFVAFTFQVSFSRRSIQTKTFHGQHCDRTLKRRSCFCCLLCYFKTSLGKKRKRAAASSILESPCSSESGRRENKITGEIFLWISQPSIFQTLESKITVTQWCPLRLERMANFLITINNSHNSNSRVLGPTTNAASAWHFHWEPSSWPSVTFWPMSSSLPCNYHGKIDSCCSLS